MSEIAGRDVATIRFSFADFSQEEREVSVVETEKDVVESALDDMTTD